MTGGTGPEDRDPKPDPTGEPLGALPGPHLDPLFGDMALDAAASSGISTEFIGGIPAISTARAMVLFCIGAKDFCDAFARKVFPLDDYAVVTALVRRGHLILANPPSPGEDATDDRPRPVTASLVKQWLGQLPARYRLPEREDAWKRIATAANRCLHLMAEGTAGRSEKLDRLWKLATIGEAIATARKLPELQSDASILDALDRLGTMTRGEIARVEALDATIEHESDPNTVSIWEKAPPALECLLSPELMFGPVRTTIKTSKYDQSDKRDKSYRNISIPPVKYAYRADTSASNGDLLALEMHAALYPKAAAPNIDDPTVCDPVNSLLPISRHIYRSATGAALMVVYTFKVAEDGKQAMPRVYQRTLAYGARAGSFGWHWDEATVRINPLYGLDHLAQAPDRIVLFVESEMAAGAAQGILPDLTVITSMGGARGVDLTDWSPLKGRSVVCWPGAGEAGKKHIAQARRRMTDVGAASVRLVSKLPDHLPDRWTLDWSFADGIPSGWSRADVEACINAARRAAPRGKSTENWHPYVTC